MTKQHQVYKCNICGNIVEVLHSGKGELVCCGEPMQLLSEKNEEEGKEKHIPVIEEIEGGIKIKVGSIPHPMEDSHYIEWIEAITDTRIMRKYLQPGDAPEAKFKRFDKNAKIRIYCNVHGLWEN